MIDLNLDRTLFDKYQSNTFTLSEQQKLAVQSINNNSAINLVVYGCKTFKMDSDKSLQIKKFYLSQVWQPINSVPYTCLQYLPSKKNKQEHHILIDNITLIQYRNRFYLDKQKNSSYYQIKITGINLRNTQKTFIMLFDNEILYSTYMKGLLLIVSQEQKVPFNFENMAGARQNLAEYFPQILKYTDQQLEKILQIVSQEQIMKNKLNLTIQNFVIKKPHYKLTDMNNSNTSQVLSVKESNQSISYNPLLENQRKIFRNLSDNILLSELNTSDTFSNYFIRQLDFLDDRKNLESNLIENISYFKYIEITLESYSKGIIAIFKHSNATVSLDIAQLFKLIANHAFSKNQLPLFIQYNCSIKAEDFALIINQTKEIFSQYLVESNHENLLNSPIANCLNKIFIVINCNEFNFTFNNTEVPIIEFNDQVVQQPHNVDTDKDYNHNLLSYIDWVQENDMEINKFNFDDSDQNSSSFQSIAILGVENSPREDVISRLKILKKLLKQFPIVLFNDGIHCVDRSLMKELKIKLQKDYTSYVSKIIGTKIIKFSDYFDKPNIIRAVNFQNHELISTIFQLFNQGYLYFNQFPNSISFKVQPLTMLIINNSLNVVNIQFQLKIIQQDITGEELANYEIVFTKDTEIYASCQYTECTFTEGGPHSAIVFKIENKGENIGYKILTPQSIKEGVSTIHFDNFDYLIDLIIQTQK